MRQHGAATKPAQNVEYPPLPPRSGQQQEHTTAQLAKIIHTHPGTDAQVLQELIDRYIGPQPTTPAPAYTGTANDHLDAPIQAAEVREAILALRPNSARD